MGKSLSDLGLKEEALPTAGQALADLPDFGTFREPPQPGSYRFELPKELTAIYDVYDAPPPISAQRIRAIFDKDHPLVIVQSQGSKYNGEPFETRMSNAERSRGKSGVVASDLDYLLRALGVKEKPKSNRDYIQTLAQQGGKQFGAEVRFSWKCDTKRNIRVKDAAGAIQEVEGKLGCGASYYQEDLPNKGKGADGLVGTQVQCTCGAVLRAFANLDNLRA